MHDLFFFLPLTGPIFYEELYNTKLALDNYKAATSAAVMHSVVTEYLNFSHTSFNHRWNRPAFLDGLMKIQNFVNCGFITTQWWL